MKSNKDTIQGCMTSSVNILMNRVRGINHQVERYRKRWGEVGGARKRNRIYR